MPTKCTPRMSIYSFIAQEKKVTKKWRKKIHIQMWKNGLKIQSPLSPPCKFYHIVCIKAFDLKMDRVVGTCQCLWLSLSVSLSPLPERQRFYRQLKSDSSWIDCARRIHDDELSESPCTAPSKQAKQWSHPVLTWRRAHHITKDAFRPTL